MAHTEGPNFTARPTIKIELGAVRDNYKSIQKHVGKHVKVAASVKADAYGLGAGRLGKTLYGAGCRTFFVATAGEGKELRAVIGDGASIYVLNGPAPRDLTLFFGSNLKPVINSLVQANIWVNAIKGVRHAPYCAIHIDTGMNRLGFSAEEFQGFCQNTALRSGMEFDHVMSHLACSPDKNHPLNAQQLDRFKKAAARLPVKAMSFANTAGIYLGKDYHFNMVRPGIGLYGGKATLNPDQENTVEVVSLMAPVLQVRNLKAGESVGYNATFTAHKDMIIATVGAGYADGIPVASSGSSTGPDENKLHHHATYQKRRYPIIGRVSMDLTIIDFSAHGKPPRIGEWVEFRGANLEEDSKKAGTINYELLTRLGRRCQKIYN